MNIVISQSMLFPWVGMLEQVRLADVFVHYDDVQYSKGSFVNRVQVKTKRGPQWLTIPLLNHHLGQKIDEVRIAPPGEWRDNHLDLLDESFQDAPFRRDALQLVEEVYRDEYTHLGAIARASLLSLSNYFGLNQDTHFADVKPLNIGGSGSDRVLSVIKHFGADTYITGHGASRYLDNEELERTGVNVMYMKYRNLPYPQSHGEFTPYVTGLDLVAHCGREGVQYISPQTVSWSEFANE